MNIAILYTAHRQFRELEHMAFFFERAQHLRGNVDIIYHSNNPLIGEEALRSRLAAVPCRSLRLVCSQENCGYGYGQFEAIDEVWDILQEGGWDWIIHLHPDIYIANDSAVVQSLVEADASGCDAILTRNLGHGHPSFATDFFAFKPSAFQRVIFQSYRSLRHESTIVPLEVLFFVEVLKANTKFRLVDRFKHGHFHRDIDHVGLWHEHDLRRIERYRQAPASRWIVTAGRVLLHPFSALHVILLWLYRVLMRKQQDELRKQLTTVN